MSKTIEPALTAEQWADARRVLRTDTEAVASRPFDMLVNRVGCAGIIAAFNDALSDSDPRKINREMIEQLRHVASHAGESSATAQQMGEAIADALETYLPP